MPNQTVKNDLKAKKIKLPQMNFFLKKTTNKIFMHLLTPFILQNFWKILRADPELWCAIFGPKMTHLFWTNRPFLAQTIAITFIYLLALSILEHLKKFLQQLQSYDDMPFSGQDDPFAPNKIFFFGKLSTSFSSTY